MKERNERVAIGMVLLSVLAFLYAGYAYYHSRYQGALDINCGTIVRIDHKTPQVSSTLDVTFRLMKNNMGRAAITGNIENAQGVQVVSRVIAFDYVVERPGEITISNTSFIRNVRDTASDDDIRRYFLYAPEGGERQLKVSPIKNAWLIGNMHSPVFVCTDKAL